MGPVSIGLDVLRDTELPMEILHLPKCASDPRVYIQFVDAGSKYIYHIENMFKAYTFKL